mmetsp:Transcript_22949/g.34287  ORF Transcript_22949/g.34287 Transcript_22949/m.34287 type:complete len:251 (-) Transcript_22949:268-1020(-)
MPPSISPSYSPPAHLPPPSVPLPTLLLSPPPPSPFSPPGGPGASTFVQHSVFLTITASGTVSDFNRTIIDQLTTRFSVRANISRTSVSIRVHPGSVIISVKIRAASLAAANVIKEDLSTALATPANASAFFSTVTGGISVEATPSITTITESLVAYPPPPTPSNTSDSEGGGALIGLVIGLIIGSAISVWLVYVTQRKKKAEQVVLNHQSNASDSTRPSVARGLSKRCSHQNKETQIVDIQSQQRISSCV